jgi:hypothetical protein
MGAIPSTRTFLAGERVTAANLNAATKTVQDFILNPPRAMVYASAATNTLAVSTFADIAFDAEEYDTDSIHSVTVNNSRLTINTPGNYLITGSANFGNNSGGTARNLRLTKNGTQVAYQFSANAALTVQFSLTTMLYCNAGDYLTLGAYQNSAGTLTLVNGRTNTFFGVQFLNP